jgi:molybdopterin/thiamine biosynthesis adenylyltransferase
MKNKFGKIYQPVVHYPSNIETERYVGELVGFYHSESNEYNIINFTSLNVSNIGVIKTNKPDKISENELVGYWENNVLVFYQGSTVCEKKPFDLIMNIFSRNSGLIETKDMLEKKAVISGVGSVGSLVALELARSGLGNFLLIDIDTLAYHNICRHQLGINDIGRFKVSAIKDRILQINPNATVVTQNIPIESVEKSVFDNFISENTIVIGCIDNREGDLYANKISKVYKVPFVSIGLWERAFAGEIFYSIPGETPCYECIFGEMMSSTNILSARSSQNHRFYTNEETLEDFQFEPGIAVDINFVTEIGIKLIIDILNRRNSTYVPKLIHHLTQFTLVCNTNDTRIGGNKAEIFSYPLQVSTSILPEYSESCRACKL